MLLWLSWGGLLSWVLKISTLELLLGQRCQWYCVLPNICSTIVCQYFFLCGNEQIWSLKIVRDHFTETSVPWKYLWRPTPPPKKKRQQTMHYFQWYHSGILVRTYTISSTVLMVMAIKIWHWRYNKATKTKSIIIRNGNKLESCRNILSLCVAKYYILWYTIPILSTKTILLTGWYWYCGTFLR